MNNLDAITEKVLASFEKKNALREATLSQSRALIRQSSLAIRAVHRDETDTMQEHLDEAQKLANSLHEDLSTPFPDLYFAGYTQDALKEFAEASITCALVRHQPLPQPDELGMPSFTYLNGLAESIGEMRRRCLDMLRQGNSSEAERLLGHMDDIFSILVTMDYPDAVTNGLRRETDVARSILERTRGDLTFILRGEQLERSISRLSEHIPGVGPLPESKKIVPPSPSEEE